MSCLGWHSAQARETALCDGLLMLDRLPRKARALLDPHAPTDARSAYVSAIEGATLRFGLHGPEALPSELAAEARRILSLHLRFLDLTDAGNLAAASHLAASPEWHRIEASMDDRLRLADCDARALSGGTDPAAAAAPHPPDGIAQPPDHLTDRAQGLQTPALPAGWPSVLGVLIAVAVVAALLLNLHRDQRKSLRVNCFLSGALQGHLYCEATEVLDISRKGCKLRLHDSLAPERPLTLYLGQRKVAARTVWCNRHYAGVRFDKALTAAELREILDHSARPPSGLPVPALPCHHATCRTECENYRTMQGLKARSADGPAGRAGAVE